MRHFDKLNVNPRIVEVGGRFTPSTVAVQANKTWQHTAGLFSTFTYTTAATAALQNAMTVRVTDSVTAAVQRTCASTNNDCILAALETGWSYHIQPHGITGGGCVVTENTTSKDLYIMFETGVTTMTLMKTAINATSTKVRAYGGTKTAVMTTAADTIADTTIATNAKVWWTVQSATDFRIVAVLTSATLAEVMALVNETTLANKKLTLAAGTGGATTDTIATALADGTLTTVAAVDAIALNSAYLEPQYPAPRFTVARTGASGNGTVTITFKEKWSKCITVISRLMLQTPAAYTCCPGVFNATAKTLTLTPVTVTGSGAAVEPTPHANSGFNFIAIMEA